MMKSVNPLMIDMESEVFSLIHQKTFDKVWRNGIFYKLKQSEVSGDLLNLIIDFLDARKQRVILNGQHSSWASVKTQITQESIFGPLFF